MQPAESTPEQVDPRRCLSQLHVRAPRFITDADCNLIWSNLFAQYISRVMEDHVPVASDVSVLSVAVMTLLQFQRQAARQHDEITETPNWGGENTKQNVLNKHVKEMEGSKKFLHVRTDFKTKTLYKKCVCVCLLT